MEIIKVENGTVTERNISRPQAERSVRALYPHTSLPRRLPDEMLRDHGYHEVKPTTEPAGDVVTEAQPEQQADGTWAQAWDVREFTPEEVAEQEAQAKKEAVSAKMSQVQSEAQSRIEAGALHNGTRWPADAESQMAKASVAASIGSGRGMPKGKTTITARDIDRNKHTMTEAEYLDMASAIRDYVFAIKEAADDHVDALMALQNDDTKTAEDVSAYDINAGWEA